MKNVLFLFCLGLLVACATPTAENKSEDPSFALFGEDFDDQAASTIGEQLGMMENQDTLYTTVSGTVVNVCQKKGCWMNVQTDIATQEEVFVRFHDYGFFVPLDIAGQKVAMKGFLFRDITSVDDLKHYAEDEGKSQEEIDAITEPEEAINFMATGVKVYSES